MISFLFIRVEYLFFGVGSVVGRILYEYVMDGLGTVGIDGVCRLVLSGYFYMYYQPVTSQGAFS